MAGILDSFSDGTCGHHNALKEIPIGMYACGVTFRYKDADAPNPFAKNYGVVSLQECCDMVDAPLLRIPDNSGCEIQFCSVADVTSTTTIEVYGLVTKTLDNGDVTHSYADPTSTTEVVVGVPEKVENCMAFVYEGDVPDDVAEGILDADYWCVVRMYDDVLPEDEVRKAETVKPAPAEWTEAAKDQFDKYFESQTGSATETGADAAEETGDTGDKGSDAPQSALASRLLCIGAAFVASCALLC